MVGTPCIFHKILGTLGSYSFSLFLFCWMLNPGLERLKCLAVQLALKCIIVLP